jgi:competence protein ComFC
MYQTFIKPLYLDVKTFVLDTLFPISCLACGEEGTWICADCKSTIGKLEHQRCIVCQKNTPFGLTHPHCQTPHGADGLISFLNYHDQKVADILIKGKYNFLPGVYEELGKLLAGQLKTQYPNILISNISLVPIPLHSTRKRWRGFNQAEVLCRSLSEQLNLPVADVLQRKKITKTQKDLKKDARLKNVDGAFALSPLFSKEGVRGSSFILVDDVTTTGATLAEAAKVLKRNGATQAICLTVARD